MRIRRCAMFFLLAGFVVACSDADEPSTDDDDTGSESAHAEDDDDSDDNDDDDTDSGKSGRDAGSTRDAGRRNDAGSSTGGRMVDAGRSMTGAGDAGKADSRADSSVTSGSDGAALDTEAPVDGEGPCPSDGQPCKILPFGDSITWGIGYDGSYRVELFNKAQMAQQKITFVGSTKNGPAMVAGAPFPQSNEGHSGWTIASDPCGLVPGIADLVPSPALDGKPHIVLLMIGTNDTYGCQSLPDAPKRLGTLLDNLTSADPNMYIVVAQLTPLGFSDSAVQTYNAALPAIVDARVQQGKHIFLVDMHTGFPAGELGDGVHPTQKGYEWMAGIWYDAIKGWLH